MIEKSSDKRISLKEICYHKWFLKQSFKNSMKKESIDIERNKFSTSDLSQSISPPLPPLKQSPSKRSCFNKNAGIDFKSQISQTGIEETQINEIVNNYNMEPKFMDNNENFDGSSNKLLNSLQKITQRKKKSQFSILTENSGFLLAVLKLNTIK